LARPKKYTDDVIKKHGEGILKFMSVEDNYWLKDYCIINDFPSENLSVWAKEHEEFSKSLKKAKDIQESKLVKMGLTNKSNPTFIIFTLKNVAKWRNEDSDDSDKPLPEKIVVKLPETWK